MRNLAVAACALLLVTFILPSQAAAMAVTESWGVGPEPFGVTIDPRDGKVYVAISNHNTSGPENMWVVDPSIPPPWNPPYGNMPVLISMPSPQVMSVLDTSLNRLFVTAGALTVVDTNTRAIVASIPSIGALGVALDPATHHVFSSSLHGVALVDGTTATVLATRAAPSGDAWWAVADDPVRHRVYVTDLSASSVVVLDDASLAVVGTVALPAVPRLALTVDVQRGLVYVGGFSSGIDQFGRVYAIDESSLQIVNTLDVGFGIGSPFSFTLDPSTDTLYASTVSTPGYPGNALVTVDLASFSVRQRLPLGFEPGQSALGPDGRLYISEFDHSALAAVVLTNSAPVIASPSFSPVAPSTASVLTANAQTSDPDNDPLTVSYLWTLNGAPIADAAGPTLDLAAPGHGDRGDMIGVTVTASDGQLSATRSGSVVIGNAVPSISLALSSTAPLTNDLLVANASANDADGDALTLTYTWSRNGSAIAGATSSSLDLRQYGDRGDLLTVTVTADDVHGGVIVKSASATVADSAPVLSMITNNASPRTNDVIFATATMSDPDGDGSCCAWYFKVNGVVVWHEFGQTGGTTKSFDLSQAGRGDRGDTVTVEAVAGDGLLETHAMVSAVVVNSAPIGGAALTDYSPTKKDSLTAYGSVYDADGDSGILMTYTWKVGQKVKLVVGPTSSPTSTFDLRDLQPGDVVTVTVTPTSDGFDPGIPGSATAVLIAGR